MNLEAFRVVQVLPPLLFVSALGLHYLLEGLNPPRRWPYLGLLLLISLVFDFSRLVEPWADCEAQPENFDRPVKSVEKLRAYRVLEQTWKEKGPGLILADFDTEAQNDATLSLFSRPLSGEWDSLKLPGKIGWAALYVNVHYQPFLEKRFPETQWFWVGQDLKKPDGGLVLAVIPIEDEKDEFWYRWRDLNALLREVDGDRLWQPHEDWDVLLQELSKGEELAKGDPFLESVYWDKVAAFEYGKLDYPAHLAALQNAVSEGYPTAAICFELGNLYQTKGMNAEAIKSYEKARQAPLDLTPSRLILKQLKGT